MEDGCWSAPEILAWREPRQTNSIRWRLHRNGADHGQYPQSRQGTGNVGSG